MAVEVRLMMSLPRLRNDAKNSWNTDKKEEMSRNEDDSWEIRAFEKDTAGNMLGCTWPPRFYTCTFCRREFRSAQALGGHMNVHRRDRVKLLEGSPNIPHSSTVAKAHPSPIFLPAQEFATNGLCLVYPMPKPNSVLVGREMNVSMDSSSPLTSDSPNFATDKSSNATSPLVLDGSEITESVTDSTPPIEEIDLELRLGRKSPPQWDDSI